MHKRGIKFDVSYSYLNNHLDSGQSGGQILRVRGSDCDWHTASIQAAIEGSDQIDSCTQTLK